MTTIEFMALALGVGLGNAISEVHAWLARRRRFTASVVMTSYCGVDQWWACYANANQGSREGPFRSRAEAYFLAATEAAKRNEEDLP